MPATNAKDPARASAAPGAHPLDRVVWGALTTVQGHLAQGGGLARRYPARIGPLAGTRDDSPASFRALAELVGPGERAGLVTLDPIPDLPGFEALLREHVDQMVWTGEPALPAGAPLAVLGLDDVAEMMALVELTHPGPFGPGTHELGCYQGIRVDGQLVAMAGERMRLPGFTEVSAVCVHPDHRGRGYAAALTRAAAQAILLRGEVPFLHVLSGNAGAIALYRKLGFSRRCRLCFTLLERTGAR